MKRAFLPVRLAAKIEAAVPPEGAERLPPSCATAEDLAAINRLPQVLRRLTAADVFVRSMDAINTLPLRSYGLVLGAEEVRAIALMCIGSPVLANHDTGWAAGRGALPVGRIFAASFYEQDGVSWCRQKFYADASEEDLFVKIDAGTVGEVSVSFATSAEQTCTICGKGMWGDECPHMPGEEYDGRTAWARVHGVDEYFETSLVWKGAAEGTRLLIAAGAEETTRSSFAALVEAKRQRLSDPLARLYFKREPGPFEHLFAKQVGSPAP